MDGLRSMSWTTPFRILGIPVRVHLGWLLVALLIGWSLAMGSLPVVYAGLSTPTYWAMTAAVVIGLGLSILLHEFAHALVGRAMGISVDRITLFVFGGVAELHEEPRTAGSELAMAVAGPLFSFVLCGLVGFAAGAAEVSGAPVMAVGVLTFIAALNFVMAVFNMLPAYPLDGGRVVRAVMWMISGDLGRATRIATGLSIVLSVLMMAAGAVQALLGNLEGGLWTILIALFLQDAARRAGHEADARGASPWRPAVGPGAG